VNKMAHSPRQNSAGAAKQTSPFRRMVSTLLLHNVPPMMMPKGYLASRLSTALPQKPSSRLLVDIAYFLDF